MARILYDRLNEIKTKHLSPQSVTGEKIADNSIEEKHIRDGVVTKRKIADGVIGTDELANGAVTTVKIAGGAVTGDKIADSAINTAKLADGAITAPKIASGAITTDKIAAGAITRDKVADKSVGTADLVDGAVTNPKIAANAVTRGKMAANSVGGRELIDGSVSARELSTDAVETPKIKDGAVTTPKIDDQAVAPAKLLRDTDPTDGQFVTYNDTTKKFKYVNAPGGGPSVGRYMPLDAPAVLSKSYPPGWDITLVNEIDLSAIVPAGAIAVHLRVQIYHETDLNQQIEIQQNQSSVYQEIFSNPYLVNVYHNQHGIVKIDADRKLDVYVRTGTGNLYLNYCVLGYFI